MIEPEIVIGLEIHAELSTKTKIYCSCPNEFGGLPNTRVCPVCMGLPGTLPVLNKKVVEYAVKAGFSMNCHINNLSYMDRKNYFYPDLPKAYQISQWEIPLCEKGYLDVVADGNLKRIGINRIHIEEDAGKLIHNEAHNCSLADYNRCGVPLIEIVSEPDMRSSSEAKAYLETIKMILKALQISDCKMQEGSIRCDVNVSVREKGSKKLATRCEMKNVNSFSGAVRAIEYEAKRQIDIYNAGGTIEQETRRWDDAKGVSFIMRTKENAQDYRYFPEPDIPCVYISEEKVKNLKRSISELPNAKIWRYMQDYGFSQTDAEIVADDSEKSALLDQSVKLGKCSPKSILNRILSDIAKYQNETGLKISEIPVTPERLCCIISLAEKGIISATASKKVFLIMAETGEEPSEIIKKHGMEQNSDRNALTAIAKAVMAENEKSVSDYRNGKKNALSFLIGKCMQKSKGKANPVMMNKIISDLLDK